MFDIITSQTGSRTTPKPHYKDAVFKDATRSAIKPLVLIPEIYECCGKRVRIDPRASFPLVYTTRGTLVAAMFHSFCLMCRTRYFYSYKETGTGTATQRVYYSHIFSLPYFQSTSMTMFEQALLNDVTNNIVYSAATFSSRSEVYHANHYQRNAVQLQHLSEFARTGRDQWKPTPMRIEEAWFLWRIICTYAEFAQLQTSNLYTEYSTHGKRRDLESLCEDLWIQICMFTPK